jgi:hypothetical protein
MGLLPVAHSIILGLIKLLASRDMNGTILAPCLINSRATSGILYMDMPPLMAKMIVFPRNAQLSDPRMDSMDSGIGD